MDFKIIILDNVGMNNKDSKYVKALSQLMNELEMGRQSEKEGTISSEEIRKYFLNKTKKHN